MKINKILAAGAAATLAVTSLSAVASAEVKTREFDMSQSIGAWDTLGVSYKSVYGTKTATEHVYATETDRAVIDFSVAGIATLYKIDGTDEYALKIARNATNTISGTVTTWAVTKDKGANFDCEGDTGTGNIPTKYAGKTLTALWSFNLSDGWWSGADVTVSGYKFDSKGTKTKVTQTAKAENKNFAPLMDSDAAKSKLGGGQWDGWYGPSVYRLVVLPDTVLTYKEGTAIAPAYFDEIEDVGVSLTMHNKALNKTSPAPGMQFTSDEKNFNVASLLLKNIRIPISDARVSYTDEAGNFVLTADVDADVKATEKRDGIELYNNSQPWNSSLVEAQLAKVTTIAAQDAMDIKIADEVLISSAAATKVDDKTPITARYKKVDTNITYPADEVINVAADDAFGFTATGDTYTIYVDGVKTTVYGVTTPSANPDKVKVNFWVSAASKTPWTGDAVKVYDPTKAVKANVYAETDTPDWSGYSKVIVDGEVAADAAVEKIAAKGWYIRKNGVDTLQTTNDLFPVKKEIATTLPTAGAYFGGNTAASVIAYCIAHGGFDPAIEIKYVEGPKATVATTNNTRYSYVMRTTAKSVIGRSDVKLLSYTGDHQSQNGADLGGNDLSNQSYKTMEDWNKGDYALQFSGLASQCADFFNGQNNGKITFHFVSPAAAGSSWVNGGIPSTEVGLKSALGSTAMALFFNYKTSTGSLQANGVVDADAATMTFDITDNLNAMGNHTIATLQDIYYGMNQGVRYSDYPESDGYDVGYLVDKVTLSFDDAPAAVDAQTDDDADDDAAVVVADDDDDDVVADDDDDDIAEDDDVIEDDDDDDDAGEIIADDDDDDDDVNNEVDYVDADDDANPGTGVGLAVIPAIVAAAAAIVSKKRK